MAETALSRRLFRPTISKKFAIFFGVVLLAVFANGMVVRVLLKEREGIAATINLSGSLRYLSQAAQAELLRLAIGLATDHSTLDSYFHRFDLVLETLTHGGSVDGMELDRLPAEIMPLADSVRSSWMDYRADAATILWKRQLGQPVTQEFEHVYVDAKRILTMTNDIVGRLVSHVDLAEARAIRNVVVLAVLDVLLIVAGFLTVRRRLVAPLRQLAETSRRFAAGHYDARTRFRSRDEIGQLAEAFDQMAENTERHIRQSARDLEEIRNAEKALLKLSQAVEHSPATVVITDRDGTIEYVNPKFTEVTGYAPREAIGQNPRILKSGTTPPEVYQDMWATLLSGSEWRGELQNRKKSGELYWEATRISSLRNEKGEITHFIVVKEDITQRRRAEDEILRLNADLERRVQERTRDLESFSYSVSHDLRAPLRGINGYAKLMKERCHGCQDEQARDYLERIIKSSLRMGDLIDDMLRLSQIGRSALTFEEVDLSRLAREVLAELAERAPERRLDAQVEDGVVVRGDPQLLRILLENLLGNAWKFTARRDMAQIALGWREAGGERVIHVRDNGAGFDPRYAERLFGAFQRLHRAEDFEGTGIGLAIVHRIVGLHEGRIWAEAEPERGATFHFTLATPGGCASARKAS
jgi:PAS domain S-box-containing protein